ncbi:hypothetical protein H5410_042853 [Solanum commersonii]|uniref:Uncharacterized protein n=1 Tax=Solanum commersonii TaxID=4109 RepID=A0A9J5XVI7_SOLCO|nr:hypothetical protein H5410_042853 [Solanum commersonii]
MPLSLLSYVSSACTDINSSPVSAFDSACAMPSPYTSSVVAGGIPESPEQSLVMNLQYRLLKPSFRGLSLSALTSNDYHCQGINRRLKGEGEKAPEAYKKEEERASIPKGLKVGVGESASVVSARVALLLSTSSRVNSTSIRRMSVQEKGMASISFTGSRGTPACRHNSVIKIKNDRDQVSLFLALIAIFGEVSCPRSIHLLAMIEPRQAALGWHKIDSVWDGMIVLLMKPNHNMEAMFMSFFSMGAPISIHLGVVSEIIRSNQPFKSFRD